MLSVKPLLVVFTIIGSLIAIWAGFGHENALVQRCEVFTQKYVTAEFSEYSCGLDMQGDYSCGTDSWSEYASDTWTAKTVNNELVSTNVGQSDLFKTNYGYFETKVPPYDVSFEKDVDFDLFQTHSTRKLTVYINRNGEVDNFNEDASKNLQCINSVNNGDNVKIKTWYGISYGFEAYSF